MVRIARVVVPACPHLVTQRGNRQETFFKDDDYRAYMELMAQWCDECGVEVWAYCRMPNQVHLIVVPSDESASYRTYRTHAEPIRREVLRRRFSG